MAPPLSSEPWLSLPPDNYAAWLWEFRRRVWAPPRADQDADASGIPQGAELTPADDLRVEETQGDAPPREKFVQLLWAERHLRPGPLFTERGRELEIIDSGRWNAGAGPDFLKAEVRVGGRLIRGDVEIHVASSGWRAHRHGDDPAYAEVILHAFLDNDDGVKLDSRQDAEPIERLCLRPFLYPDLQTLERTLDPDERDPGGEEQSELGTCHEAVLALDPKALERFLDLAARERLEDKVSRLRATRGESLDQAIYQALATYLGQGATKPLFFLLARRASLDALRPLLREVEKSRRVVALQAIYLHVAGLIPTEEEREKTPFDGETCDYLNELESWWAAARDYFADRLMPPTRRWFGNVRPGNFPTRLLAGFAHWTAGFLERDEGGVAESLIRFFPEGESGRGMSAKTRQKFIQTLAEGLEVDQPDDFWARRYSFAAQQMANPMKLIGPSRASLVTFNALLPSAILTARERHLAELDELCFRLYEVWPKLQGNAITRRMAWRLFAGHQRAEEVLVSEARMQALHQIYKDCCDDECPSAGGCGYFGAPRAKGREGR
jgi:hypothetical protein